MKYQISDDLKKRMFDEQGNLRFEPGLCPSVYMLPEAIKQLNVNKKGRYDWLIALALKGAFHDYKFTLVEESQDWIEPKSVLMFYLQKHGPLWPLRQAVIDGTFDDKMDDLDKEYMREYLANQGASDGFLQSALGL